MSGQGEILTSTGSLITGNFSQNSPNGDVTILYPNENFYKGQVSKTQLNGVGTMEYEISNLDIKNGGWYGSHELVINLDF
jgi:hypothetical protein